MIKIAVDGMGGDYAPQLVVEGAVQAANSFHDVEIVITGKEDAIKRELYRHKVPGGKISICHASEVVEMSDSPVQAVRKKKDSSLSVAIQLLKKKKPSIGLLNIGEEESKGTEALQEAYKLIRDSGLNFVGNIEGRDFFTGKCDCIVCDGFSGNVVLKMTESILEMMIKLITKEIQKDFLARIGALLCKPAFESIRRETNYEEAGGAPLLGVDGVVIIGHGISSAKAICNAIRVARESVVEHVNEHIIEGISSRIGNHANLPSKTTPIPKVNP